MAYAHVRGETVLATTLDDAETLNPLLERSSSPTHDRKVRVLERQRAIAAAEREMDRKRVNQQALQEIDAAPLKDREKALARREETLRETGYGIASTTDELERREAATAQRETKLREQEELHAELLQTAAQLREVSRAELNPTPTPTPTPTPSPNPNPNPNPSPKPSPDPSPNPNPNP